MEAININIPEIKVENDFSIIYKGKDEDDDNNIIEIKTSKDEVVRTLRYFKQRINEVQHLNEYYIHDKFSCNIFKEFIESIKTKALTLTEYNYQEYYQLSKKYEYYELQQEIEKFAKQRPDLKAVINQLLTKSNFIEENEEVDIISDPIKEEIISKHLDICLRNPNLIKLPIQMLNRILNSPNRVLNDYHLLFDFIMR